MADPTITVTNLGDQGVEAVLGVIYPPQVALVGFGRIVERPWAVDGMLGVRPLGPGHASPPTIGPPTATRAAASSPPRPPAPDTGGAAMTTLTRPTTGPCSPALLAGSRPRSTSTDVEPDATLREALELDSMDFLNLVVAINEATGIDVPEHDYAELTTVDGFAAYMAAATAEPRS